MQYQRGISYREKILSELQDVVRRMVPTRSEWRNVEKRTPTVEYLLRIKAVVISRQRNIGANYVDSE